MVVVAMVTPAILSSSASVAVALMGSSIMVAYLINSRNHSERHRLAFGDAKVCSFTHVATPFTSMFSALARENARLTDITEIRIETGTFSDILTYVNGEGKVLLNLVQQNPGAKIHIFGLNDLSKEHDVLKSELSKLGAPGIVFHDTKNVATTHRTVIRLRDGRIFLWFEEVHLVRDGHHFFPFGAYLMRIDDFTANRVERDVATATRVSSKFRLAEVA